MIDAKEMKAKADIKKAEIFCKNLYKVASKLINLINYVAEEKGVTKLILCKDHKYSYKDYFDEYLYIDKKTYKDLKFLFKMKGYKVRKSSRKITISWK